MPFNNRALQQALDMLNDGRLTIDNQGQIWRHQVNRRGKWVAITPRRAENAGGKGYLRLTLQIDGRLCSVMAHRVIWTYYKEPIAEGLQINHKDLDKTNNRLSNLEVVDQSGNIQHSLENGRNAAWSVNHPREWRPGIDRLTQQQVAEIISQRRQGIPGVEVAKRFGVTPQRVSQIWRQSTRERS